MDNHAINNYLFDIDIPIREDLIQKVLKKRQENNNILNNKKRNKNNKKGLRIVVIGLLILFISIFTSSLFKLFEWYQDSKKTTENIKEIEDVVNVEEVVEGSLGEMIELVNVPEETKSDYWYYIKFPLIQVDFNELVKKNSDTVAWIQVNNTNINYPVVKGVDNDYYLNRSYDKKANDAGWVFMDYRNSGTLNDKNTIIYAHNRKDSTMFGSLKNVFKVDWYNNKDNHIIKMSTPTENSLWQIFSVYKIEAESYYITTDFNTDESYLDFLNTLKKRSVYRFDSSLNINDSILTLSTCYSNNERTVVHAKKIKKSAR